MRNNFDPMESSPCTHLGLEPQKRVSYAQVKQQFLEYCSGVQNHIFVLKRLYSSHHLRLGWSSLPDSYAPTLFLFP